MKRKQLVIYDTDELSNEKIIHKYYYTSSSLKLII